MHALSSPTFRLVVLILIFCAMAIVAQSLDK